MEKNEKMADEEEEILRERKMVLTFSESKMLDEMKEYIHQERCIFPVVVYVG